MNSLVGRVVSQSSTLGYRDYLLFVLAPLRQINKREKENGMAKVEQWHERASVAVIMNTPLGQEHRELIAELIASCDPNAPASTAPKELVEKYWLEIAGQSWPVAAESIRDILTRFASEITVDAEKVWCELLAIYVKLNGPFEDRDDYEDIITVSKTDLIAALKAAGGGK